MKLVLEKTGIELKEGDVVYTFRGERRILRGWRESQTISSTGRVYVEDPASTSPFHSEYYPSVIGAKFIEE